MKRTPLATLAVIALPLLGMVGLTACNGDDPQPKFAPPEETTSATEPTPSGEPSGDGEEPWEQNSRAGAVAFVKHWFQTFSEAMDDGDVKELRKISADDCETCIAFADRLERIYAEGGFYESDGWVVLDASSEPPRGLQDNERLLLVRVRAGAERSKESSSGQVITNPDVRTSYTARMAWEQGAWTMLSLVRLT